MIFHQFFTSSVHRTIYIVPEWRRNPKNDLPVAVMMDAVIDPKLAEEIFRRSVDMDQVVNEQVASVAHQETGSKREGIVAQHEPEADQ